MAGAGPTIEVNTVTLCDTTGYTVGPLHKGHVGTTCFVHCGEGVYSSEMKLITTIGRSICNVLGSVLCREVSSLHVLH